MKVLACTETFKGTLEAESVGAQCLRSIETALRDAAGAESSEKHSCVNLPLTDGGAGFLAAMAKAVPELQVQTVQVLGPNSSVSGHVTASYGVVLQGSPSSKYLVVEMASACGLPYIPHEDDRDPLVASSHGVGQLIKAAMDAEASKTEEPAVSSIYLGLGGTATNDGAIPALVALGALEVEIGGKPWKEGDPALCGGQLRDISKMTLVPDALTGLAAKADAAPVKVVLVTDVNNPLLGAQGATEIFGPQKGARTPEIRAVLEEGLSHCAKLVEAEIQRKKEDADNGELLHEFFSSRALPIMERPGAGAAGGAGCFLSSVLANASIQPGAQAFAEMVGLKAKIAEADLVVTGEGSFDTQTLENGKTIDFVRAACLELNKPLLIVCGRCLIPEKVWNDREYCTIVDVLSLTPRFSVERAMAETADCIHQVIIESSAVRNVYQLLLPQEAEATDETSATLSSSSQGRTEKTR